MKKEYILLISAAILLISCNTERRLTRRMAQDRETACMIAYDMCDVRDSIVRYKEVFRTKFDTLYIVDLPDEWYQVESDLKLPETMDSLNAFLGYNVCDSCYTDQVTIETATATATGVVYRGKQYISIQNKDSLQAIISIYKDSVNTVNQVFRKSMAQCNLLEKENKQLIEKQARTKAWRQVWMWIVIILLTIILARVALRRLLL